MEIDGAVKLVVGATPDALKACIATHIATAARLAIAQRGRYILALSGGSMPHTLTGLITVPGVDWARVFILFTDERCVPLDHEDSNYNACNSAFLNKLPIPVGNILTIDNSQGTAEAIAQDYEKRLMALLAVHGALSIDTVLLGIGPDGHTASLFPGHALLCETKKLVAGITDSPKPPPERITLTYPALRAAQEVVFIAVGVAKASLFKEALCFSTSSMDGPREKAEYAEAADCSLMTATIRENLPFPAFQVRPASGELWYYTDREGASFLPAHGLSQNQTEKMGTGFL